MAAGSRPSAVSNPDFSMVIGAEGVAPWGRGRGEDAGVEAASPDAATVAAAAGRRAAAAEGEVGVAEEAAFEVWLVPVLELWDPEWELE